MRPASWSSRSRGQDFVSRQELGSGFSGRSPSNTSETSPAITNKVDTMLNFRGVVRGWLPPIFGTTKTIALSTNALSWFASMVLDGVLGPPRLLQHT